MGETSKPPLFPLIRHLSAWVTPWLLKTPLSANQATTLSLAAGLAAAALLSWGAQATDVYAGGALVLSYLLDNADGEIARAKGQSSKFGMHYDTFVDWAVHSAFFAALGAGVAQRTGEDVWLWMGLAAAAGGTLNYLISLVFQFRDGGDGDAEASATETAPRPEGAGEWALFIFRELARADFCFLVVLLGLSDALWLLLPAGMVGAQVYWITQFIRRAREFHV
ncbi:MAG: CDP-alcohol phosphatidyltransferase family protein [Magnetovibrio sp.]|nr:CDP-alcohol phosphatidyltransferase family protein [Magnetovibrio sp.]